MKFNLKVTHPEKESKSCLIVGVFEDGKLSPAAQTLDKATQHAISNLIKKGVFSGKSGQTLALFQVGENPFEQILLVGCGKEDNVSTSAYRKLIAATVKSLINSKTTSLICYLTEIAVDKKHKVVSTPAYMLAKRISEVEEGVSKLVNAVLEMVKQTATKP